MDEFKQHTTKEFLRVFKPLPRLNKEIPKEVESIPTEKPEINLYPIISNVDDAVYERERYKTAMRKQKAMTYKEIRAISARCCGGTKSLE